MSNNNPVNERGFLVIYTLDELREKIRPIAEAYALPAVYIFGSYARGEATEDSDVDILVQLRGSNVFGWGIGGLYEDLKGSLNKKVDIMDTSFLKDPEERKWSPWIIANVMKDRVRIL